MAYPFRDEHPNPRPTWATWGLLLACIVVFAYLQPKGMQGLTHGLTVEENSAAQIEVRNFQDRWALVPCEVTHGRSIADGAACNGYPSDDPGAYAEKNAYTPFLTAMFLHASLWHLAGNLLFLWVFGRGLEQRVGSLGVLGLFLAGGVVAFIGYVMVNPEATTPLLGASGAIAALMGAYLILQPRRRILSFVYAAGIQVAYLPAWAVLAFFFVSQFFTSPNEQVAWQAHVAGMVFGAIVAAIWAWRDPTLRSPKGASDETVRSDPDEVEAEPWPTALPEGPPTPVGTYGPASPTSSSTSW